MDILAEKFKPNKANATALIPRIKCEVSKRRESESQLFLNGD